MVAALSGRSLFADFVAGTAQGALPADPRDGRARALAVRRARRPLARAVADALQAQAARRPRSPERDRQLAALSEGAAAVVTGQQAGLFLGPLFTVYKAATAVVLARALEAETGERVVPVFWLQSEDHDLPEVAVTHAPRPRGEPLELRLPADPDDRRSVAHRALPQEVDAAMATLRAELAGLPHGEAHVDRLARHYRPGAGWMDAFAGVLAELFAAHGLVLVDPRDPALAAVAAPVHRAALERAGDMASALGARADELAARGWEPTVHVRAGSPLSFVHPEGPQGPRFRLEPAGEGRWREVGGAREHAQRDLLALLDREPLAFSSSALLRPVVQDTLLPTAAYVGGPAEVAYFAQLPPLYAAFGMEMPLVVPRARLRVIDETARRLLEELGLRADEVAGDVDAMLARSRSAPRDVESPADVAARLASAFEAELARVEPALVASGQGLDRAVEKARAAVADAAGKLAAKYERALLHRDEARVEAARRLAFLLAPHGQPQERFHGLACFAARAGDEAFLDLVVRAIEPLDFAPRDVLA